MKNKGFGHLKTRLFTIKTSKNVGFAGPWYIYIPMSLFFLGVLRPRFIFDPVVFWSCIGSTSLRSSNGKWRFSLGSPNLKIANKKTFLVTSRPIASFLFLGPGVDLSRLDAQSLPFSHWEKNNKSIDFLPRKQIHREAAAAFFRKPFISDPGCDAGGFEVLDLGRVINSNLMGKATEGDDVMMAMFGWEGFFPATRWGPPPWRKTRKGLRVSKMKGEVGFV